MEETKDKKQLERHRKLLESMENGSSK